MGCCVLLAVHSDVGTKYILAAAEVEEPGDFVQHRYDEAQTLLLLQLLAQILNLVFEALARVLFRLSDNLLARSCWSLVPPHQVYQVVVDGFVLAALLLDLLSKFASVCCSDYARIYTDDFAPFSLICGPLLDGRYILYALLQELPIAVQLLLGLVEVASVGGEGGFLVRNDCISSRAGKATDVC
jgi:hypothetical protein